MPARLRKAASMFRSIVFVMVGLAIPCSIAVPYVEAAAPVPTLTDVPYGADPRQKLDFYRAKSEMPTPLLFFIHGGGWMNGDKSGFNNAAPYLAAGISVVSIEYRLVTQDAAAGVKPPVAWPLGDAARALQFVRTKKNEWNLDTARITASGSSAGACSALWVTFHDDMADPQNADPVARESTRLFCAAVVRAQTTLDPKQMTEWIPNARYGAHAFGFVSDDKKGLSPFEELLAQRETILPWLKEYSPYELLTADDPPMALYYDEPPAMGQGQANMAHSANFGVGLATKLKQVGIEYELVYPGAPNVRHPLIHQYLIEKLKESKP